MEDLLEELTCRLDRLYGELSDSVDYESYMRKQGAISELESIIDIINTGVFVR